MAFGTHHTAFLLGALRDGARFDSVITLGRQWFRIEPARLVALARQVGVKVTLAEAEAAHTLYADDFLKTILQAKLVDSMDTSDFEGASIVSDLNVPVAERLHEQYDAVIDGGTLEHVFNYPTGLRNAMEMVKVGGRLYLFAPANNFFGHGFYQLSPELFHRTLVPENGFEIERMVAFERHESQWYSVADPAMLKERLNLINGLPVTIMVQARRTKVVPIFEKVPQQSDYAALWEEKEQKSDDPMADRDAPKKLGSLVPGWVREKVRAWTYSMRVAAKIRRRGLTRNRHFSRIQP